MLLPGSLLGMFVLLRVFWLFVICRRRSTLLALFLVWSSLFLVARRLLRALLLLQCWLGFLAAFLILLARRLGFLTPLLLLLCGFSFFTPLLVLLGRFSFLSVLFLLLFVLLLCVRGNSDSQKQRQSHFADTVN